MTTKDDEKDLELDGNTSDEETPDTTDPNNTSEAKKQDPGTDWEKSYKGLQKTSAAKQKELQDQVVALQESIDALTEKVAEKDTDNTVLTQQLVDAKKSLDKVQVDLESVNQEKAKLDARVERAEVISKKYPSLAPFQAFIPQGESLEEYEKNAEEFKASLAVYTDNFVSQTVEGATPTPPERDQEEVSESEEDRLWTVIVQTAGVAGKEEEYRVANEKWLKIQRAKQQS